jgi:hypothetical protein
VKSGGARAAVRKAGLLPLVFVMSAYAKGGVAGQRSRGFAHLN